MAESATTAWSARLVGMGTGEADPLGRVDSLMEIITRAHAVIYTRHRRLIELGLADEKTRRLLDESVRIVLEDAPEAARKPRLLALEQAARQLLDPAASAERTDVEQAIVDAEARLRAALRRQQQIADELTP